MTMRYDNSARHIREHASRASCQASSGRAQTTSQRPSLCARPVSSTSVKRTSGCALQVGQAVDYKESDIWWHGVVWAKSPGSLSIYLPGQRSKLPPTCVQPHE